MQRDWDVIRTIFEDVEKLKGFERIQLDESKPPEYVYNAILMVEAKLLDGIIVPYALGTFTPSISKMTWEGHDLYDSIRNDTVWNKVKSTMSSTVGTVSIFVLKEVAKKVALELINV